eukprot:comp17891_c0_seq1/m.31020 comp17891_c0_seq1/g.31020  ORF comp17891_c0_seq1/g.31020 comp17891_c0_seq1/m.31020 type:complete len:304 (-) comp17891_c0_seq1:153-1064(-)
MHRCWVRHALSSPERSQAAHLADAPGAGREPLPLHISGVRSPFQPPLRSRPARPPACRRRIPVPAVRLAFPKALGDGDPYARACRGEALSVQPMRPSLCDAECARLAQDNTQARAIQVQHLHQDLQVADRSRSARARAPRRDAAPLPQRRMSCAVLHAPLSRAASRSRAFADRPAAARQPPAAASGVVRQVRKELPVARRLPRPYLLCRRAAPVSAVCVAGPAPLVHAAHPHALVCESVPLRDQLVQQELPHRAGIRGAHAPAYGQQQWHRSGLHLLSVWRAACEPRGHRHPPAQGAPACVSV